LTELALEPVAVRSDEPQPARVSPAKAKPTIDVVIFE